MWPRHRFHSSKLRAEPSLCAGLGPGTGSRVDASLQQLRAKTGNGSGKDQSGKKLSPGLFKTTEIAATPPPPASTSRSSTYSPCPPPREPAPRVSTLALTKTQKNQDTPFKTLIPELSDLVPQLEVPGAKSELRGQRAGWGTLCSRTTHGGSATGVLDSMSSPPRGQTAGAADRSQFP